MIRDGQIAPGTRLREEELARNMGVSRTPVREALSRMQSYGLIALRDGGLSVVELDRPQIMELYGMRAVLEGSAAGFAAENASSSDLVGLRHVANLFDKLGDEPADYARMNTVFHRAISEAAHNRYQIRMIEELNDYLALLPRTTFEVPGRAELAKAEHRRILDAIEKRDPEAAEKAARDHISAALQARLELLFDF